MDSPGGTTVTDPGAALPDDLLDAAEANLVARREAGAEQLRIAYAWAFSHRRRVRDHVDEETRAERDVRRIGAYAYPVGDYASGELALAWQIHPLAAQKLMGHAVDLVHRLPHTWAAVQALRLDEWVARKISTLTRELGFDQAQWVDAQIADKLGALPPGWLLTHVEAKVVAADQQAAEEKWAQAASERTVHLARETEHGTRNLFARLNAADAVRLMATIMLIAKHLPDLPDLPDSEGETSDQRLARALALLADPQAALALLAGRDPRKGKAVVYVHTTPGQLATGQGVARVEDLGPMTATMLADLLGHSQITLKPVIDLNHGPSGDAYEIPTDIAERVHLAQPADVFPFAEGLSRHLDLDHHTPYDRDGPPGQTAVGNLGKLNRRHHRLKTFAPGWTLTHRARNRYWWSTPDGRSYLVDRNGTHPVGKLDVVVP